MVPFKIASAAPLAVRHGARASSLRPLFLSPSSGLRWYVWL